MFPHRRRTLLLSEIAEVDAAVAAATDIIDFPSRGEKSGKTIFPRRGSRDEGNLFSDPTRPVRKKISIVGGKKGALLGTRY